MIKQKFTLDEETGYWVVLQFPAKEKEKAEEDVRMVISSLTSVSVSDRETMIQILQSL
jgi:hypothetical protein